MRTWPRSHLALTLGAMLALAACASRQAKSGLEFDAAPASSLSGQGAIQIGTTASTVSSKATDLFEKGRQLMAQGEPLQASLVYEQILRLNPSDAVALNNLGIARASMGDYYAADDDLRRAAAAAPQRADIAANLAVFRQWLETRLTVQLDSPREDWASSKETAAAALKPVPSLWSLPSHGLAPGSAISTAPAAVLTTSVAAIHAAGVGRRVELAPSRSAAAASLEPGETVIEDAPGISSHSK